MHAYNLQAWSRAPNSGKPTSAILNVTLTIVFVALQAPHCGTFFNQCLSFVFIFFFFLEKAPGVVGKKNLKNVTPNVSETRLHIRLKMIIFLILLFQGQYHEMVIAKQM